MRAGILDERASDTDLTAEIRRDPHLTEDQKRTLLRVYESFRHENGVPDQPSEPRIDAAPE